VTTIVSWPVAWWLADGEGAPQVSVEQDYATRLGIRLGDTLTYDVAARLSARASPACREVRWDSFQPNFVRPCFHRASWKG